MRFQSVASGSNGNCSILSTPKGAVIIDAGISRKRIVKALQNSNIPKSRVLGILVTHAHYDHIMGLAVLHDHLPAPVIATPETIVELTKLAHRDQRFGKVAKKATMITPFNDIEVGPFSITSFPTQHDIAGACGFSVNYEDLQLSYVTDTGSLSLPFIERMQTSEILVMESNHDEEELEQSRRPSWLKNRIRENHLSNKETFRLLSKIINEKTQHLYLAHLSGECNDPSRVCLLAHKFKMHSEYQQWKWAISSREEMSSILRYQSGTSHLVGGISEDTVDIEELDHQRDKTSLQSYFD